MVIRVLDLFVVFLAISAAACAPESSPRPTVVQPPLLLYVSARSDDGSTAGSFGDLVAFEVETARTHWLTDDRFYDSDPAWAPDGRIVVFESRRVGPGRIRDLSTPSHLFALDVATGVVAQYDTALEARLPRLAARTPARQYSAPAYAHGGQRLAFAMSRPEGTHLDLAVFDEATGSLRVVLEDVRGLDDVRWSNDDRHIAYTFTKRGERVGAMGRYIGVLEVATGQITTLDEAGWQYGLGGLRAGRLLYAAPNRRGGSGVMLIEQALDTDSTRTLGSFDGKKGLSMSNFVYGPEGTVYFIGTRYESEFDYTSDIYAYDLATGRTTRLTIDGRHKHDLRYTSSFLEP